MPFPQFDDPLAAVRRVISREANVLLDRVVGAAVDTTGSAVHRAQRNLFQRADDLTTLIGEVPHKAAETIVDLDRGFSARRLTAAEASRVTQAYGARVNPADVRIVDGPGLSAIAAVAFLHGNPAITIGNTIYIRHDRYKPDMTLTTQDLNMLIHECMHVIQYKELGFARFGKRYLAEMRKNGNDPDRLYDYKSRKLDFAHETLEGEAAIVGDYAGFHASSNPADRERAERLRSRLHGTGIYGN